MLMSIEAIREYYFYNFQWSFGVTCWEIFSLGRQPYGGVDNYEMTKYLSEGNRLEQPTLCSDEMLVISTLARISSFTYSYLATWLISLSMVKLS